MTGLVYCAIDAPFADSREPFYDPTPEDGLFIDAGPGPANEDSASRLPATPEGCFLHWIFVHDWNRFIHICGRDADLAWLDQALPPRS